MKRILCVYATRQIDSNLFMASTIFRGLQEAGYETHMYFAGTQHVIAEFKRDYSRYFDSVIYQPISESWLKHKCDKSSITHLGYSFYRHFIMDSISQIITNQLFTPPHYKNCDCILSFIPPVLSGRLAIELRKKLGLSNRKLIQFWTDPLSLGRCDSVNDIPRSRIIHKWQEHRLLKAADKVVFWFPLLCDMEMALHPQYAYKMRWSDVSYIPHQKCSCDYNSKTIKVGLFGAYPANVRDIKPLIDSIAELTDVKFIIRGDGDLPYNVSNLMNLDIESGRMPLKEIEKLEQECDILLSLSSKKGIAPGGKTFYYASYPKPIIHIADGVNGDYYNNYLNSLDDRYICCRNIKSEIISKIRHTIETLPSFKLHIPSRMDAAVIAKKIIED